MKLWKNDDGAWSEWRKIVGAEFPIMRDLQLLEMTRANKKQIVAVQASCGRLPFQKMGNTSLPRPSMGGSTSGTIWQMGLRLGSLRRRVVLA